MQRRVIFNEKLLPYLLLAPQLAVTLIFFFWPAGQAIHMSVLSQDAFGNFSRFIQAARTEIDFGQAVKRSHRRVCVFERTLEHFARGIKLPDL